jgi:hypothetical protein
LEKCVDLTVLYGNITPKTPNGTFCALPVVFVLGLLEVLFIHIAVVITKYICDVVIVVVVVVVAVPPIFSMKNKNNFQIKILFFFSLIFDYNNYHQELIYIKQIPVELV